MRILSASEIEALIKSVQEVVIDIAGFMPIPANVLKAQIFVESAFDCEAVNVVENARGLLQIRFLAWKDVINHYGKQLKNKGLYYEHYELNRNCFAGLLYGVLYESIIKNRTPYINKLKQRGYTETEAVLFLYNAGNPAPNKQADKYVKKVLMYAKSPLGSLDYTEFDFIQEAVKETIKEIPEDIKSFVSNATDKILIGLALFLLIKLLEKRKDK